MNDFLKDLIASIPQFDNDAAQAAQKRQNKLTKPTGSLGMLEDLSIQIAGITANRLPRITSPAIFVYAADHGVAAQGVSAYPSEVTAQMVLNYARGGAVINTLAKQINAQLIVADVGVAYDFSAELPIEHQKIRPGTADWTKEPAMTLGEANAALRVGVEQFSKTRPVDLVIVGEMGIGNTTTSAALVAALTNIPASEIAGRGTGIDDTGLARKIAAIEAGLKRHTTGTDVIAILASLGGLEIAAMAGTILAAAATRVPVLLDGFISTCAALVAVQIAPAALYCLIAAHRSPERGHTMLLERLQLKPLLDLNLRLGEASGAALAVPLLQSSLEVLREVATFGEAGVSDRE